jgi:hypothetical protein
VCLRGLLHGNQCSFLRLRWVGFGSSKGAGGLETQSVSEGLSVRRIKPFTITARGLAGLGTSRTPICISQLWGACLHYRLLRLGEDEVECLGMYGSVRSVLLLSITAVWFLHLLALQHATMFHVHVVHTHQCHYSSS